MTPPVAVPFTTTDGATIKAFYDESRQLLFATNLGLNEVDVLSGSNLTLQERIPIASPWALQFRWQAYSRGRSILLTLRMLAGFQYRTHHS